MVPGIPVHVIHRGNNRGACFFADQDRAFYLFHLGRLLQQTQCALHAYCLMTNHVHLLLTPRHATSCALLMKRLAQLHSQYVNRAYRRTGTLWEGRFRSCLVQSEGYLLCCYRYIEMNPVRAGMTGAPEHYEWSSHRANAYGAGNPALTQHEEYLRLGSGAPQLRAAYRALFGSPGDEANFDMIRQATNGNLVVGDKAFKSNLAIALGRRVERGFAGRPARAQASAAQMELDTAPENVVCP